MDGAGPNVHEIATISQSTQINVDFVDSFTPKDHDTAQYTTRGECASKTVPPACQIHYYYSFIPSDARGSKDTFRARKNVARRRL